MPHHGRRVSDNMKVIVKYGLDETARIDLLADSSILPSGRPLFVPDWARGFVATAAVAVRVSRLGKCIAHRFATRYWDAITGCLVTEGVDGDGCRVAHGALSLAHDGALLLGQMLERDMLSVPAPTLRWAVSGEVIAEVPLDVVRDITDATISQVSQYMTLKMGDLLCFSLGVSHELVMGRDTTIALDGQAVLKTNIR